MNRLRLIGTDGEETPTTAPLSPVQAMGPLGFSRTAAPSILAIARSLNARQTFALRAIAAHVQPITRREWGKLIGAFMVKVPTVQCLLLRGCVREVTRGEGMNTHKRKYEVTPLGLKALGMFKFKGRTIHLVDESGRTVKTLRRSM